MIDTLNFMVYSINHKWNEKSIFKFDILFKYAITVDVADISIVSIQIQKIKKGGINLENKDKEGASLRQELLYLINKKGVKQSFIVSNCNISKQHLSNYLKNGHNISNSKKDELKKFLENYYI